MSGLPFQQLLQKGLSHLKGEHRQCYAGTLGVGAAFLASALLGNTAEFLIGCTIIGSLVGYTYLGKEEIKKDDSIELSEKEN